MSRYNDEDTTKLRIETNTCCYCNQMIAREAGDGLKDKHLDWTHRGGGVGCPNNRRAYPINFSVTQSWMWTYEKWDHWMGVDTFRVAAPRPGKRRIQTQNESAD